MIEPTLLESELDAVWDAIIIGAGPAGAFLAYLLAANKKKILLLDKSQFPRAKVCGCCLNSCAIQVLNTSGLFNILSDNGAVKLDQIDLFNGKQRATLKLPGSFSLSRSKFDAALIEAAVERGAHFFPEAQARVLEATSWHREVIVDVDSQKHVLPGKIVIVADGLNGRSLDGHDEFATASPPSSKFGCGAILDNAPEFYAPGRIYMASNQHGYVGLVRLEDNRTDIAAALDKNFSRACTGTNEAVRKILEECELPVPEELDRIHWSGTESLTRQRRRIAGDRLFVIGDACGYTEPFTGEGIAWALSSAHAVSNLVLEAMLKWQPGLDGLWHQTHKELIAGRQQRSGLIAAGLRNGFLRQSCFSLLSAFPAVATPLVNQVAFGTNHSQINDVFYYQTHSPKTLQERNS